VGTLRPTQETFACSEMTCVHQRAAESSKRALPKKIKRARVRRAVAKSFTARADQRDASYKVIGIDLIARRGNQMARP